ncbi:MAG: hypothetical protein M3442_21675 [Chloroflexota bacterium]|nr:hypothetical protein [Chloroflexota bacterium]
MQRMSRRALFATSAVLTGGVAVAGCGAGQTPAGQATGASTAPATVVFWCRDTAENYAKLEAPMIEYRKRHPHITIADENSNLSDTEFNTKLRAAFAGGAGPDAWWSATRLLRPLQSIGAVADLSQYYSRAKLSGDAFYGNSMEELTIDGKAHGVPQGWGIGLLGINKSLLQRAGADLKPDFDKTWTHAQFIDLAKRAAKSDVEGNLGTWGIEWGTDVSSAMPNLWEFGADLLDKDLKKAVINSNPASVQAFQWWADLTWVHRVQPRRTGPDRPQGVNMWNTGRQGINGNAGPNVLIQWNNFDFEWDVVLRPLGPKGRHHRFYSNAYYMGKDSKVKDATWDYLSWAGTDGMEATEAAGGYNIPGYRKIADTTWLGKKTNNINRQRWLDAAKDGKAQPLVAKWDEQNTIISKYRGELLDQKINAKVAVESIDKELTVLLGS